MTRFFKIATLAALVAFGLILGWSAGGASSLAQNLMAQAPVDFGPPVPLEIVTTDGRTLTLQVELADSPEERRRGLMFRQEMAPDHGMLFDFGRTAMISMWMRNTVLPLDMVFANRKGRIVHIHEGAVPYSEEVISSRRRVYYVLELNAGIVAELGIAEGDRLVGAGIETE